MQSVDILRLGTRVVVRAVAVAAAAGTFASSCAVQPQYSTETSYNRGVDAWKAKNYSETARQWSTSALLGDVDALNNLAFLYSTGQGVTQNEDIAVSLWHLAAYSGHSEAQWHLGGAYEQGLGVPKDLSMAYAWYGCAIVSAQRRAHNDVSGTEAKIESDAQGSLASLKTTLEQTALSRGEELKDTLVRRYGIGAS